MSKNALECLLFYIVTFLCCVKERMGPPAACAGQIPVCMRLMFLERAGEGMKQRRLIETKSTPCLCWLPFSSLKTLAVDNYSAEEHQCFKLMCNRKSEPDIKTESYHIWFKSVSLENATAEIIVSLPPCNHSFASLQLCDCTVWDGIKTTEQ